MKYLFTFCCLLLQNFAFSQYYQATVQEDYQIQVKKINSPLGIPRNTGQAVEQIAGYPLGFRADPNTKNFRNVTLADLNQDGTQEIIFAASNKLMAFSNQILLWEITLTGTGIYPPSVADVDNDGDLEIVQVTGGNGKKGRVYLVDHEGNILSGFPKNYNDNWILTTAALADLDGDQQLEIIFLERNSPGGNIHILTNKGEPWSENWPVRLPGTPAVTPSIGDIDNDGQLEIVVASTTILYAYNLDGQLKTGWPVDNPNTKFSFQSPILADLDGDQDLEIIGASHGIIPEYYILEHDGTPYKAWPFFVPDGEWTFSTPSVVKIEDTFQIFMSRPRKGASKDMLYAWNEAGDLQMGFPIEQEDGLEGIISIADLDDNGDQELIFGSNRLDEAGYGFIHAFHTDGSGAVAGFPLRPKGWTLLNGVALGDVDGDGQLDATALSYTTNFGASPDSVFLNVYNLDSPYKPASILWSTYKGDNSRAGNRTQNNTTAIHAPTIEGIKITVFPNPIADHGKIQLILNESMDLSASIYTVNGQLINAIFDKSLSKGIHQFDIPELPNGMYFLKIQDRLNRQVSKSIISIKK